MTPSERRRNAKRRSAQCTAYEANHSLCRLARMVAAEVVGKQVVPSSGHVNLLELAIPVSRLRQERPCGASGV